MEQRGKVRYTQYQLRVFVIIITNGVAHVLGADVLVGVQDGGRGQVVDDPVVVVLPLDRLQLRDAMEYAHVAVANVKRHLINVWQRSQII